MPRHLRIWTPALLSALALLGPGCDRPDPGPPDPGPPSPPGPAAAPMTAEQFLARARDESRPEARLRLLEAALGRGPLARDTLVEIMEVAERAGIELALQDGQRDASKPLLYLAARAARLLIERDEPLSDEERRYAAMVLYNEACNYALDGRPDDAVGSLRAALDLGFDDPTLLTDEELDPLRDRDDFRALIEGYRPAPAAPAAPGPAGQGDPDRPTGAE